MTNNDIMRTIVSATAQHFGLPYSRVVGKSRRAAYTMARFIAMYVIRFEYGGRISLQAVGDFFGGRDHATVYHAVKVIEDAIYHKASKDIEDSVEAIKVVAARLRNTPIEANSEAAYYAAMIEQGLAGLRSIGLVASDGNQLQ